tara:strand:- start:531 stop:665 length:135 start_codon:yes stop_codon:yes gene_type:complete
MSALFFVAKRKLKAIEIWSMLILKNKGRRTGAIGALEAKQKKAR